MTREIDPDFKRVFSFELLLHRMENTKSECEQYTKILLEKTITGLDGQGKFSIGYNEAGDNYIITARDDNRTDLVKKLTTARTIYQNLNTKMGEARSDVTTRSWMDGKVLELCHLIDAVIYPVAFSEGLLDMSVTLDDFKEQFANKSSGNAEE